MIYFEDCTVGKQWQGNSFELIEADIIEFAKKWDPQPFHADKELAKESYYGGITAPSAYLFAIASKLFNEIDEYAGIGSVQSEFKIPQPARAGEQLTFTLSCVESRVSETKPDRAVVTFGLTLTTTKGVVVFDGRSVVIMHVGLKPLND